MEECILLLQGRERITGSNHYNLLQTEKLPNRFGGWGANRPVEMKTLITEMYKSEDGLNHQLDPAEERIRKLGRRGSVFVWVQRNKTSRMCGLICRERLVLTN